MQKRRFYIALCCGSLIIGGIIYIIFRPDTYVSNLFDNITFLEKLRLYISDSDYSFMKFYLPDYLWCFSLCCGLVSVFEDKIANTFICCTTAFVCGVVWETFQFIHIVSGVFDFFDILMYLLASISVAIINLRSFRNEKVN